MKPQKVGMARMDMRRIMTEPALTLSAVWLPIMETPKTPRTTTTRPATIQRRNHPTTASM